MSTLTELIQKIDGGDREARDQLFSAAYPELRKLARSRLRDGGRNVYMQTTALVHESYLRYLQSGELRAADRRAFFAFASSIMRSVIIDTVRELQARRRGGGAEVITLDTLTAENVVAGEKEILDLHEALQTLEAAEPRLARVVEMRYFGGYTAVETAEALEVDERTVRRDWDKARLLLMKVLES